MIGIHVHAPAAFAPPMPFAVEEGESVAEIAARQHYRLAFFALLNEEWLPRERWECRIEAGDRLAFVTLPARGGGGGKDIFRSVLQIAIVAAAVFFAGPAGLGLTGGALVAARAGALIASGLLVNALMPPQSAGGAAGPAPLEKVSPTYSLSPQGNQARLGQVEPMQYGFHRMVPDFAATPYSEFRNNDLYLFQLFSLGLGRRQVHEIGIERTALWTEVQGFSGAFSDVEIEIVPPGQPVTLFPANVLPSAEVSGQTLLGLNEAGADWIGPFRASPAGVDVNRIGVDFVWAGGSFHVNDAGTLEPVLTSLRVEIQEIDDFDQPLGAFTLAVGEEFSFAAREQQRVTRLVDVADGQYWVRVKRVNDASTDVRTSDEVTWTGLRGYVPSQNVFERVTVVAVAMRATNQLSNVTSRRFYVDATTMLPRWDPVTKIWSAPQATRRISDAAADIARNSIYGWGLADARIDLETLAALEQTWTARGETFDGIFDQKTDVWRALNDVLHVGRAYAVKAGASVTFVRDEKKTTPRLLLSPRNIVRGSFSTDFVHFAPDTPDDVIVRYFDSRVWAWRTVRATLAGSLSTTPATLTVFGITDRTNAWRYGMFRAAVNKLRRVFPRATVELEGRMLKRGDLVPVSHPLLEWGRSADVTGFDAARGAISLSAKPLLGPPEIEHFMSLKLPNGTAWGPVKIGVGTTDYEVVADPASLAAAIAAEGDPFALIKTIEDGMEPTVAIWGAASSFMQDCILIGATPTGGDRMTLDLQADDDAVYTADEGAPPPETDADQLPRPVDGPDVGTIFVTVDGTRFAPELIASIARVAGAQSYIWEMSNDHVSWRLLQAGDLGSWRGPVEATTVWIRVTAIGTVRGQPSEWFADLTATEAVPAAVSTTVANVFFTAADLDIAYPDEDGIEGLIVKRSTVQGFAPEIDGTVVYDGTPVSRVSIGIDAAPTVYIRAAAYNRFGKVNLNWSAEQPISARTVEAVNLSPELTGEIARIDVNATAIATEQTVRAAADDALASDIATVAAVADAASAAIVTEQTARADGDAANAAAIQTVQAMAAGNSASIQTIDTAVAGIGAKHVVKLDVNGFVTGTELANGGPGQSTFTILVDNLKVVKPGVGGAPATAPFTVVDGVVTITEAVIVKALVEHFAANFAQIGTLITGRQQSLDGTMFADFNTKVIEVA